MNRDHEKIKELISSYIDGVISEQERREVEDLILKEGEWQEYYKEMQRLSATLQEWADEEVSADMANEIQKTLLDEKLREGASMKGDTWVKVGGGALVTFALCMIIGIVYMRTYSKEARVEYMTESQLYQPRTYEPYYLLEETAQETSAKALPEDYRGKGGRVSSVTSEESKQTFFADSSTVREMKKNEAGYDLAASYKADAGALDALDADAPVITGAGEAVGDKAPSRTEATLTRNKGGFQTSSYDTRLGLIQGLGDPPVPQEQYAYPGERAGQASAPAAEPAFHAGREMNQLAQKRADMDGYVQRSVRDREVYDGKDDAAKERANNMPSSAIGGMMKSQSRAYKPSTPMHESEEQIIEYRRRDVRPYHDGYDDAVGDEMSYPYPTPRPQPRYYPEPDTEEYDPIYENPFLVASGSPLSTFSIDVDTASYSNVRRFLERGQLPPADAVRIEEMVNYFSYDYAQPKRGEPFSVSTFGAVCPWNPQHLLVQIGLKGNVPAQNKIPPSNLVFLIDVSGSMNRANKLPLLKKSLKLMVDQLRPDQQVAIVTYSGSARMVLDSTSGAYKHRIHAAIDNLRASGSTAGEAGLRLAYRIAKDNYIRNGNNRVILATDGDFNVGMQNDYELVQFIQSKRKAGVFLSILGFGSGNYKDSKMEKIADNGNGNYHYIDSLQEGRKVLVSELGSTLFTIAKDVKVQVEFNPQHVHAYRLIGYENRVLNNRDFNNDRVDAGEVGAGHTVTALYEIVPAGGPGPMPYHEQGVDRLKYQKSSFFVNQDLMTVKLRYKPVNSNRSRLIQRVVKRSDISGYMSADLAFASAVAEFGMLLRNSRYKGNAGYDSVLERAGRSRGTDPDGRRGAFLLLVEKAKRLDHRTHYPRYPYPEPYPRYPQYPYPTESPPLQFK